MLWCGRGGRRFEVPVAAGMPAAVESGVRSACRAWAVVASAAVRCWSGVMCVGWDDGVGWRRAQVAHAAGAGDVFADGGK